MSRTISKTTRWVAAAAATVAMSGAALAADVEILPNGLMAPTTTEQTKPDQFKKAPPWRIGV